MRWLMLPEWLSHKKANVIFFKHWKLFSVENQVYECWFSISCWSSRPSPGHSCKMVCGLWGNSRFESFLGVLLCKPSPFLFKWISLYSKRGNEQLRAVTEVISNNYILNIFPCKGKQTYQGPPRQPQKLKAVWSFLVYIKQTNQNIHVRNKSIHASS